MFKSYRKEDMSKHNKWCFSIPSNNKVKTEYTIFAGEQLFVLGSNGSGKSKLLRYIDSFFDESVYIITPYRDVRFRSSIVNITKEQRDAVIKDLIGRDEMDDGYYQRFVHSGGEYDDFAVMFDFEGEAAIENLKHADAIFESEGGIRPRTHKDVRIGTNVKAKGKDYIPLISKINKILSASYFYFQVEYLPQKWEMVVKRKGSNNFYGINKMSDGECAVLLLICDIMIAPPNSLILIDEPERHLHVSNIFPLLSELFAIRNDCAFVVATHEINNVSRFPKNKTVLLYNYSHNDDTWEHNVIENSTHFDERILSNVLGPRHPVIFVEGYLDSITYKYFFPQCDIEIVGGCDEIIRKIKELKKLETTNYLPRISILGIIDKDNREDEYCKQLQEYNIFILKYYSVESLYYHPKTIKSMLAKTPKTKECQKSIFLQIEKRVIQEFSKNIEKMSAHMILRKIEYGIRSLFPDHKKIIKEQNSGVTYNWSDCFHAEVSSIEKLIENKDMASLIERYPVKEMGIRQFIYQKLGYKSSYLYEEDVRNNLFFQEGEENLLSPFIQDVKNNSGL